MEEALQNFIKSTHISLEQANKNHEIFARNNDASIKNLDTQIGQLSRQIAALSSSSGGFNWNTVDNPNNETCKVVELNFWLVTRKEEIEKKSRVGN